MSNFKPLPTRTAVLNLLNYDKETGVFTWRKALNAKAKAGQVAGTINDGYRQIQIGGTKYAASRLAWLIVHNEDPKEFTIDHKDRNRENNRITNLRKATQAKQNKNKSTCKGYSITGTKTVRYQARIKTNGVSRNLGCYDTPEEARAVYLAAKIEEHKEFIE